MTSKHVRGLGWALLSVLPLLTGWVALGQQAPATPPEPEAASAEAEPPAPAAAWRRVRRGVLEAVGRHPTTDRAAVHAAVAALGAGDWHAAGHTGKGVKVAVLDAGFRGYRAALGTALPAAVTVRSFRKDGRLDARDSQHGVLCAEVIHRVAPGAELLLANWEAEEPGSFLDAVRWARDQGARVISCSMIMPSWSDGEGGGAVHARLARALAAAPGRGDAAFFASAGNTALRAWSGVLDPDPAGWHQWSRGQADNPVRPLSSGRVSVEVTNRGDTRYEIVVSDPTARREVARAVSQPVEGGMVAVARFEPAAGRRFALRLRAADGTKPKAGAFHLTVLGGKLGQATRAGSIPFPGDGPEVVAVGAIDERGRRHAYSSCGPSAGALKPDLTAVVPFPSLWRPGQPFSGTSAAAPQAAALAALLWGRHPDWSAARVREALRNAAGKAGRPHSPELGHGAIHLPR